MRLKRCFSVAGLLLLASVLRSAELPFPVGEELTYTITWNLIPVAWSKATTSRETIDGREMLALRIRTQTYPFFNHIFKVDDLHESLIDPQTFLPIRYTKNLHEGEYRCHEITTFDFNALEAHYVHQLNGKEKTYAIDPDTRDLISFMYFMRSVALEPKQTTEWRVMSDEKIYELILNTHGIEEIGLSGYDRKIPGLELVPEAKFDGLFVRKGKAALWVSRDSRKLLTVAKVKVPFGRVRIELRKVNGPGDDFWITEKKEESHEQNET
jgi:hypothetical protein